MRGITSITFARAAEPVRRPGSFEVPFEPCSGRDEFRSQAKARLTADQNGSGLERKQLARLSRSLGPLNSLAQAREGALPPQQLHHLEEARSGGPAG